MSTSEHVPLKLGHRDRSLTPAAIQPAALQCKQGYYTCTQYVKISYSGAVDTLPMCSGTCPYCFLLSCSEHHVLDLNGSNSAIFDPWCHEIDGISIYLNDRATIWPYNYIFFMLLCFHHSTDAEILLLHILHYDYFELDWLIYLNSVHMGVFYVPALFFCFCLTQTYSDQLIVR